MVMVKREEAASSESGRISHGLTSISALRLSYVTRNACIADLTANKATCYCTISIG